MKKPNILFILSDDQGAWAFGRGGTPELHTPNLDKIAEQGMQMNSFFCASPVCSPARASLLTGRIPSQHGVHDWIRSGNVDADIFKQQSKILMAVMPMNASQFSTWPVRQRTPIS